MFAAIDFRIAAPSLLHITAGLLQDIGSVEPAFEVTAAKLAFLVLLVASPLSRLLNFDFVLGKLRRSLRARGYGCGQKVYPRSSGERRRISSVSILLEGFCAMPEAHEARRDVTRTRGALFASTLPPSVVPLGVFGAERGRTSDR